MRFLFLILCLGFSQTVEAFQLGQLQQAIQKVKPGAQNQGALQGTQPGSQNPPQQQGLQNKSLMGGLMGAASPALNPMGRASSSYGSGGFPQQPLQQQGLQNNPLMGGLMGAASPALNPMGRASPSYGSRGFPQQPLQQQSYGSAMLPSAQNYAFGYNDASITPYMTQTIAVPVGIDLEEERTQRPLTHLGSAGKTIRVFDASVGRTRNYVETTVSIAFSELLDLRRKFARKVNERYVPSRSGSTIEAKLQEIKQFFFRLFGYYPMGLDKAFTVKSSDTYQGDLDTEVVLTLFVPEQEEIEASTETGEPTDDNGFRDSYSHERNSRSDTDTLSLQQGKWISFSV